MEVYRPTGTSIIRCTPIPRLQLPGRQNINLSRVIVGAYDRKMRFFRRLLLGLSGLIVVALGAAFIADPVFTSRALQLPFGGDIRFDRDDARLPNVIIGGLQ